jgi:tetratricopeptide (TPR) repeat protein
MIDIMDRNIASRNGSRTLPGLLALALALGLAPCIDASAQERPALPSVTVQGVKAPSDWKRAESAHFVVYSDTDSGQVTRLLDNLERLDYILRIYLRDYLRSPAPEQKLTFYFHDRIDGFNAIAIDPPHRAVGLYNSCPVAVQASGVNFTPIPDLKSEQLATYPVGVSQSYIFEAYARHFIYRYTDIRAPAFFIDGMAQFFGSTRFSDTQFVLGRTPAAVGSYFNVLDDGYGAMLQYDKVLEPAEWKAPGYVWTGKSGAEGAELEYQAKSWLLVHYMLSTEDRRKRMARYLDLVHGDKHAIAAFEQAFDMKVSGLDYAMWRYHMSETRTIRTDFAIPTMAPVSISTLPRAAGDVVLASAQLKSCPDRKTGEALLGKLNRLSIKDTNNEFVRLTLSRAQIDWGNPDDAVAPLTALLRAQPRHAEAMQLLGIAHLRLADTQQGAGRDAHLKAARRYLTQARELDPTSPEAAYALFKAELAAATQPSKLALASAIAASNNAPEATGLARKAALAYALTGQDDGTETVLASLAQNGRDAKSAAWAVEWRQRLARGVGVRDLVEELRRDDVAQPVKEWTVAADEVVQVIKCKANVEKVRQNIDQLTLKGPMDKQTLMSNLEQSCLYR